MNEKRDYFSYLIGVASIFLTILSFFKGENQKIVFLIWGAAGLLAAVIMIYINTYLSQLNNLETEIKSLKKEYSFSEQIRNLKEEIKHLKMDNRGSINTDIVDFIKVVFLLIIVFLILKALGIV